MSETPTAEKDAGLTVVLVHPDDVNLADAKALAAQHDATVEGNRYVPRGQMLVCRPPHFLPRGSDA